MREIHTPLQVPELDIKGQPDNPHILSDSFQQVLTVLCGFWKNRRTLLKSSPSGILFTSTPPLEDIIHVTADENNFAYQGGNIPCTQLLVMAHPDNGSKVWVRTKTAAQTTNSWPLDAGDAVNLTVTNLQQFRALIVTDTEKLIIAYSI